MELIITPYEGVGPFKLGMTPSDIEEICKHHEIQLSRKSLDGRLWDRLDSEDIPLIMSVYYTDEPPHVYSFNIFNPSNPIFQDRRLLKISFNNLRQWFKSIDESTLFCCVDQCEILIKNLGIGITSECLGIYGNASCVEIFADGVDFDEHIINMKINIEDELGWQIKRNEEKNNRDYSIARSTLSDSIVNSILSYQRFGFFKQYISWSADTLIGEGKSLIQQFELSLTSEELEEAFYVGESNDSYNPTDQPGYSRLLSPFFLRLDTSKVWSEEEVSTVSPATQEYVKAMLRWAEISEGFFTPESIEENWASEVGPIHINFTLNGIQHQLQPDYCGPWIDTHILIKINQLIESTQYKFYVSTAIESKSVYFLTADIGYLIEEFPNEDCFLFRDY